MVARRTSALRSTYPTPPEYYTARDVARFCEVDLKTIHHWADRGKLVHGRTAGRHLRFRRGDIVRFLRAHDYPFPFELRQVRCRLIDASLAAVPGGAKVRTELERAFEVKAFDTGIVAIAHALIEPPDALILAVDDPTLAGAASIAALKADGRTAWLTIIALGSAQGLERAVDAGADLTMDVARATDLPAALGELLAVLPPRG